MGKGEASTHEWKIPLSWLLGGILASNLGAQISFISCAILVFRMTGSSAFVGGMGLAAIGPMIIFGFAGGRLADMRGRRFLIVCGQSAVTLTSAVAAFLAAANSLTTWGLLTLTSVWASATALMSPARISTIPLIVPKPSLARANSWLTAVMITALSLGPLAGSILLDGPGPSIVFTFDALLSFAATVAFLRLPSLEAPTHASDEGDGSKHWIRRIPREVRAALGLDTFVCLFGNPKALFPAIGAGFSNGGIVSMAGYLYASMAVGALLGAFATYFSWADRPDLRILSIWTTLSSACLILLGVSLLAAHLPVMPLLILAAGVLALFGCIDAICSSLRRTLIQRSVSTDILGRAHALLFVLSVAAPRGGEGVMGVAGDLAGAGSAYAISGVLCSMAGLTVFLISHKREWLRHPSAPLGREMAP